MSVIKDLFHLQEIEIAINLNEQAQARAGRELADDSLVKSARAKLEIEQKRLEETSRQQKNLDYEIEDFSMKLKTINRKLYDGKTTNSKELTALQTEAEDFRRKRSLLEDRVLELMEETEMIGRNVAAATRLLSENDAAWEIRKQKLNAELERLQADHRTLEAQRQESVSQIEPAALEIYKEVKKRKGTAVARLEQGTCMGCRIAVSNAELQQARSGNIIRCSNCGRILYIP